MKILLPLFLLITSSLAMETNQTTVALPDSAWEVTALTEQSLLTGHAITFEFDAGGSISGNTSCNSFGGACTIEGNSIKVGPLRSTRRACEPEIMKQEHKFLALLRAATVWEIDDEGTLILRGEEGEIRAQRRAETPQN